MISSCRQQWTAVQTFRAGNLDSFDTWMHYIGLGGMHDGVDITGYLSGLTRLPRIERDVLAQAINEMLLDEGVAVRGAEYSYQAGSERSWVADGLLELMLSSTEDTSTHSIPASLLTRPDYGASVGEPARGMGRAWFMTYELRRCHALFQSGLLNTGAEERFDRITARARKHFDVSSASIALITEDRQIIKSVIGPIGEDLPRDIALCSRTIEADRTLIITEARTDPDYSTHPLVIGGPRIQFYAGHPLTSADGWRIGTLCLIDDRPRSFSTADARTLRLLAGQVQNEIWVR